MVRAPTTLSVVAVQMLASSTFGVEPELCFVAIEEAEEAVYGPLAKLHLGHSCEEAIA